jgi:hypothetical protein
MLWWLRFQALARHALALEPTERFFHYDRANGERPLVRGEQGEWLPIVVNRERYAAEHSARRLKALASLGHCAAARNGALRQSQDGKMKRSPKSRLGEILSGCLVAVLIGLGTVALTNADAIVASGDGTWGITRSVLAVHVVLVALPFIAISILPNVGRAAWLTAGILTAIVWSLPSLDQLVRKGEGGANIGLGIFMLISPLFILGGALAARAAARRRGRASG